MAELDAERTGSMIRPAPAGVRWHRHARTAAVTAFYLALALALLLYLRDFDWARLARLDLRPQYLLLALPFALAGRLAQPLTWSRLLSAYGESVPPYSHLTYVYARAWMGRYIPGKVAWIGGKVLFGMKYGMKPGTLAVTSLAESGIQLASAIGISFLLFALGGDIGRVRYEVRVFSVIAFAAVLLILTPPVFNAIVGAARRVVRRGGAATHAGSLSLRPLALVSLMWAGIHLLSSIPLYFIMAAVGAPVAADQILYLLGGYLLAGSAGALAVFAPNGIGMREGVLIAMLNPLFMKEALLVGVVLLRLWTIAMDVLYYLVGQGLRRVAGHVAPDEA